MTRILRTALITAAILFAAAESSRAQSIPRLDRLEVAIWPEYDQPAALIIIRGFVSADTPLPAVIPLAMPFDVPEPNAVAKRLSTS